MQKTLTKHKFVVLNKYGDIAKAIPVIGIDRHIDKYSQGFVRLHLGEYSIVTHYKNLRKMLMKEIQSDK